MSDKSLAGCPDLVVVAPDYGDHRSATTSRYAALCAASQARVRILCARGLLEGAVALPPVVAPRGNARSLLRRAFGEAWQAVRLLWRRPRADRYLVAIPPAFSALLFTTALRLRGEAYWLDVRDIYPDVLQAADGVPRAPWVMRSLDRWFRYLYAGAEGIVCATDDLTRRVRDRTPPHIPVRTVRNGFAPRFTPQPVPDLRRPMIVSHGTLGRFQNTELLAQVIMLARSQGRPWRFRVIGDGPSAARLVAAQGESLEWIREARQEEMPALLREGAVGLTLRSTDDISAGSIPVRMLEYIGLGIPIVSHPETEGGDVVRELGIGKVEPAADAAAILLAIDEILAPERQALTRTHLAKLREGFAAEEQWRPLVDARHQRG